jgi:S-adenosylmethionine:tRNA ribosyltransferase-isomerase
VKTVDFDYELPVEYIAQTPIEPRDASRLLVLDRQKNCLRDSTFNCLGEFLKEGDLLVLNQTRVIPARLYGRKIPGGGKAELLLLRKEADQTWEVLVGGKGLREGRQIEVEGGPVATVTEVLEGARRRVFFNEPIGPALHRLGRMPLPPYIHTPLQDPERYQTVYARLPGSAAAPTAGLHFTPQLIAALEAQGVLFAYVTLHVGLDTFLPVTEELPTEHPIHTEWCQLTLETAQAINRARQAGGRVVAVGTTSVRTLESAARQTEIQPYEGPTGLYILPGYVFTVVDAIITNFHLPRSTLIMLASAFAGRERILNAYQYAIQAGYRFYSFGDAMLIV